jgi:amidohydrolase
MAVGLRTGAGDLRASIRDALPNIVELRRELHQHPEIRFEEKWTSDRIARYLDENDVPYKRGYAKGTGLVATVEGDGRRTVALRSDMDALEIQEETGVSYASKVPQRMHACGHDGHMAILCGAARALRQNRDLLKGRVRFVFQPAEENAAGGRYMVEEGVLDGVDAAFGLHGWPWLPVGKVAVKHGAAMASADFFRITITGKGTHAADPASGVDPIVVASHVVTALQSLVSREINPWDPAVVTVARIDSGFAWNVIPERAVLEGTFRALSDRVRDQLLSSIPRIASHVALAHRAEARIEFPGEPYPALHNDPKMSAFAADVVSQVLGRDRLVEPENATMGAEDFAFYLRKVPGAYLWLGVNPSATAPYAPLHSPRYDFNDDALPIGIEVMCRLATEFLART